MIFLVPGGDAEAQAIGVCADTACVTCGVPLTDILRGNQVTRENVTQCCGGWDGKLLCFWGHGSLDGTSLLDAQHRRVVSVRNVAMLVRLAGILAVACHSARVLGPVAVEKKGLKFFMGFIGKFWVVLRNDLTAKYPLFSGPLRQYRKNKHWVQLGRLAIADLIRFVALGCQRAGCSSLQDVYQLVTGADGKIDQKLMKALPPLTKDGVVQAFAGSQNLLGFRVIPELPLPTES